ncbi:MAG: DUF4346 domain-containing protein [Candidatus Aenigmarchaeota archaeon]|nr:DUF4346 domain-containing protein [Candidatus Aenigmarchaeota archaeon]
MEWPIFYRDELKLGNPDSSVGICTLWTRKEIIHSKVPENKYAVCGNLYTVQGINPMLKNILAKPTIRYIALCGADLMKSGQALMNFVSSGCDSDRKIIGSSGYIDSNVDPCLIESFRSHVKVIDLRGKEEELPNAVEKLKNEQPFMEAVFITELETRPAEMKSGEVAFKVRGRSIADVWLKALDVVMKFGEEKQTEYQARQNEVINLVTVIEGDDEKIAPWLNITEKDLESYFATFFSEEKPEGVEYTYGNRLLKYATPSGIVNQVENALKRLKEVPHTRRAVAVTWNVEADSLSKDPPCITQIVWSIKGNKLYETAIIRSNDMFGAWPLNAFALRRLQRQMAKELEMEAGKLITVSTSAHIYENNWKEAKAIIDKYHADKPAAFSEDENGYFIVKVENGEIIVEHYTREGLPTGYVFRGNKAQVLYRRIINENLISMLDHAAYIGHELARAEMVLKEGKKFVQDEA